MWKNQKVQIVFPAYNEEGNIRKAIEDFYATGYVDNVLVVDNNSSDDTKSEILQTKATYIFESIPGYGSALSKGLREASADLIITCEPDGTFSAHDLIKLLIYSEDFDVVFGTRTSKVCIWDGANMNWFLRVGNLVVAKFLEYLFNGPCLTDMGCTMKLIKNNVLVNIKDSFKVQKSHFQPEFMINCILASKRVVEIPVNYYPRKGISKITGSFTKAFKLGIIMILYTIARKIRYVIFRG